MSTPFPDVEGELRQALVSGGLLLHYQPVVDLHDASLGGVEALLRWRHEGDVIAAGTFLPHVHDPELRHAISLFVFDEAARQAATWRRRFATWIFPVSVNVAPDEFDDALVDRVIELRTKHALPPGAIALDVSEPVLLVAVEAARARVEALKRAGAQIVVDDFGTTHARPGDSQAGQERFGADASELPIRTTDELLSSVVALEAFPIDVLKVDRQLIDRCFDGERESQVVQGIVKLVHLFGIRVLAEGVESGDEAERLRHAGFDLAQGYYFQRPHGPGHIDRLLHDLADAREAFAARSAR
ncbi:MAG TPA: cyclic diguanylate phosphodiesterase [Acidimicrobiia bacterium]|nr:cyclic diguanylate phosphodiesterase [Acidimicrobiia bacterium]